MVILSCSAEVKPLKERLDGPVSVLMLTKWLGEACGSATYSKEISLHGPRERRRW